MKSRFVFGVAFASALGAAGSDLEAQARKLNAPLQPNGDVERYSISADRSHVLYVADQDVDQKLELYGVRLDARAAPVKLNGPMSDTEDVRFELSSHERVVFGAAQPGNASVQLQSVPIDGGIPLVLNPPLVSGGNVTAATITPDETRVVYLADQDVDDVNELYVVAIDGSTPAIQLSHALTGTDRVASFALDPTGVLAAYVVEQNPTLQPRLYVVPLDVSSGPLLLASHRNWSAKDATFSPDGQWITYTYTPFSTEPWRTYLLLVPADGSRTWILLSDNVASGYATEGVFTADSERVIALERSHYPGPTGFPGAIEHSFLSSSTLNGAALMLNQGITLDIDGYLIDPGRRFAYYWGWFQGLYRVPTDGSAAAIPLAPSWSQPIALSSDGAHVVYLTRDPTGSHVHLGLHSLSVAGGPPAELQLVMPGENFRSTQVSADSRFVVYLMNSAAAPASYGLFSVPIDGSSAPRRLHDPLPANRSVVDCQLAGGDVHSDDLTYQMSGGRAVFLGDLETNNKAELFLSYPGPVGNSPKSSAPPVQSAGG